MPTRVKLKEAHTLQSVQAAVRFHLWCDVVSCRTNHEFRDAERQTFSDER